MLAQEIAPTEIGKHENIIRVAQEELANMDVLVCGRCLRAFNFVEEFQAHKEDDACEKENSSLKESLDTKPTIWAFTLWKATQLHTRRESNSSNSWALYQHWVKLEESVREPWIVAGRTIQSFGKIGHGPLQDMPVRITKTVVNPNNNNNNNNSTANSNNTSSSVSPTRRSPAGKQSTAVSQLKDTENERPKSKPGTPTPTGGTVGSLSGAVKNNNRIAIRVDPKTEQRTEEAVESIVAKRFNPRRKTHEYLVKWIDRSHNENTWEVMANLERVPYFLQMFEKQLARQKLKREKSLDALKRMQEKPSQQLSSAGGKTDSAPNSPQSSAAISPNSSGVGSSRPSRTSKTKAMDQFKQWVNESCTFEGSTSPSSANEDESATEQEWSTPTTMKRKLNHADSSAEAGNLNASNDSMDLEDLEEDLIPSHTVKRLKNGGSSVQLNKPKMQTSMQSTTPSRINGNSLSNSILGDKDTKMGDIIYTEDITSSGVFRKPEMPNTTQTKRQKIESPVRYLSHSEIVSSNRGIFRMEQTETTSAISPAPKIGSSSSAVGNTSTSSGNVPAAKRMAAARVAANNSPVTVGQRTHVLRTPGQTAQLQRRPMASSTSTPNALRQGPMPARTGARMLVTRANTPQHQQQQHQQQQQRQVVGGKAVTPEQKILQLSKSGDLKVTRKVMTREDLLAQRAAQVRQQRQQQAQAMQQQQQQQQLQHQQQQQQQQVQTQKVQQLTPLMRQQRQVNATAQAKPQPIQIEMEVEQEELTQHQAQLCPITGKLIGQEETQLQMEQEQHEEQQREQLEAAAQALLGGDQQVLTNEDGSALLVRGEDGTVYQVAGKNAEGQTILVTQGPDGEQQFAYVAAAEGEDQDVLTLDNAVAEAVAAVGQQSDPTADGGGEHILVNMTEEELAQHQAALLQQQQQHQQQQQEAAPAGSTPPTAQIHITTSDGDGTEAQIPAEVVQADLPSPGGTRRVVLLLQDGTFMMTDMADDQFKTLNIQT
ncbi:alpha-protein kinase 1 isoform X2 [Drosophila grimshawi]|uniref:GH14761 n=2 Tax=Drosophila grimshawi TaxID=7222 RepID=B4J3S0_DROGR|nr:alpha-protein kinase 1 isoform X2 [Drosophila grimshawi]EDV97301.1 GH14761 [Drosophila grimshawi]